MKPFSPDEARAHKQHVIPDQVIEAVNELLAENYYEGSFTIKQHVIVDRIKSKMPDLRTNELFEKKYLDFESVYEDAGWTVYYDKPDYTESYDPYFKFSRKK